MDPKLDPQFCLQVDEKFEAVKSADPEKTPYEILEANPHLSIQDLKQKYLDLSRRFHPDRFFGKNLGPYKPKLDTIFTRIQKAYATLKDPHLREAIDKKTKFRDQAAKPAETKRQARMDPFLEKIGKAETYYKAGLEQLKAQDFVAAANSFVLASQTNPTQEKYKKSLEDARPLMHRQKAKQTLELAKKSLGFGMGKDVLNMVEEALRFDPTLGEAQFIAGKCIVELNLLDRFRDAKGFLMRARAALPKDPEPCIYLGKVFLGLDDSKAAKKEFEEALKRSPQNAVAKQLLSKIE